MNDFSAATSRALSGRYTRRYQRTVWTVAFAILFGTMAASMLSACGSSTPLNKYERCMECGYSVAD